MPPGLTAANGPRRGSSLLLDPLVRVPLEHRRSVRLLAMFALLNGGLTALGGLELAFVASLSTARAVLPTLFAASVGYGAGYALARRGRIGISAAIFVLTQLSTNLVVSWCLPAGDIDVNTTAAWLTLSILTASALGGSRQVVVVAASAGIGLVALMAHHHTPVPVAVGVMLFLFGFTGVALVYLEHRNGLEADRQEQLRARNVQLEELRGTLETRVSELEEVHRALAQHEAAERELEVAARVAAAEQEQLQRAIDARTQFVARMSHELRTPLNAIVGFADLVGASAVLPDSQRGYVSGIRASSRHMLQLINDLLDQAKMESGRLELEVGPFALEPAVREAVALLEPAARDKGLTIHVSLAPAAPAWVSGDALRFRQVIVNLLGNALKFTTRGEVRVRVRPMPGGGVGIDVADEGPGIPTEQQTRIFDAYRQADETVARQHGGTGLGLSISRQLARAMRGDLTVSSTVGVGATFHFVAPLPTVDAPTPTAHDSRPGRRARTRPLRVLLADDDLTNRVVGTKLLELLGHSVEVTCDGEAAVATAVRGAYDLIIMDVEMPKLDGLSAARALRAAGLVTPILAFTAHASPSHGAQCREAGMNAVMHKPMDLEHLRIAITNVLEPATAAA